jgi:hypothetical protein
LNARILSNRTQEVSNHLLVPNIILHRSHEKFHRKQMLTGQDVIVERTVLGRKVDAVRVQMTELTLNRRLVTVQLSHTRQRPVVRPLDRATGFHVSGGSNVHGGGGGVHGRVEQATSVKRSFLDLSLDTCLKVSFIRGTKLLTHPFAHIRDNNANVGPNH